MHVIEFLEDGTAECLHTDLIPLGELGTQSMRRASTIEWLESEQHWVVSRVITKEFRGAYGAIPMFRNPSREACVTWEREFFNAHILRR